MNCYSQTIMSRLLQILASLTGTSNPSAITTRIPDDTRVIAKEQQAYTYIPLTPEQESDNITNVFVKPGITLTVRRPVSGEYTDNGSFRYIDGPITHYLVEGMFTNSSKQDSYLALCVPRGVIEERFQINN